jgi:long-chain acyl-CoA synthetase
MNYNAFKTYNELFDYIVSNYENNTFLNYVENNNYKSISITEFKNKVEYLALGLKDLGIQKGEHIAIFANSSPFWLVFDFALHKIGAVSVPIFANISNKNLLYEIDDSKIKYIFIDTNERVKELEELNLNIISLFNSNKYISLDSLTKKGLELSYNDYSLPEVLEEDLFSVIYTSGNTGTPKGVELTHKNIITQIKSISLLINLTPEKRILSLLPLAHIFERAVMSFYMSQGVSIYFVDEITNVSNLMKKVKPHMMTVVPRLLEKIFSKIKLKIEEKSAVAKFIAKLAFNRALLKEDDSNFLDSIYEKIVYTKLREAFGGEIEIIVSGGANLDKEIYKFFVNIGLPLYQGYGLTEFSPVICTNYPGHNKVGTCGLPLNGVEVKILDDGELIARGDSVMKSYKNDTLLTKETVDKDGWLHTGDLAQIDKDGFISIKSRKKELFKTSTGEYVSAINIEQKLNKSIYVDYAVVIANARKYTTALIFIDHEVYKQYIQKKALKSYSIDDFYKSEKVKKSIKNHIDKINKNLNSWERIINYEIITTAISIEGGELTPSMKICRNKIEEKYSDLINKMY